MGYGYVPRRSYRPRSSGYGYRGGYGGRTTRRGYGGRQYKAGLRYGGRRITGDTMRRMRQADLVNITFKAHQTVTAPCGANTAVALQFTIDSFGGVDPFKKAYDLFRVVKIRFEYRPRATVNVLTTIPQQPNGTGGQLMHALDWDDNETWESVAIAVNAWGMKKCNFVDGFERYFSPRVIDGYKLATGSSTIVDVPKKSPWISTTAGATAHYGVKYVTILGGATTQSIQVDTYTTLYCQFKHRSGL